MASVGRLARETSIDVVRGADVLLMLFVNEMAGVRGTPAFLRHTAPDADGMTLTDVVFPAFLFITGMAARCGSRVSSCSSPSCFSTGAGRTGGGSWGSSAVPFALSAQLFGGVNFYEKLGENTWVGFVRSTVFAWIVVRLCGLLRDAGVRMQI